MSENHSSPRDLLTSQSPQGPKTTSDGDSFGAQLPTPDDFERRLSADSKVSNTLEPAKGFNGQADIESLRRLSAASLHYGRTSPIPGGGPPPHYYPDQASRASKVVTGLQRVWQHHKGVLLVALSQLFGALMNLAARLLELEGEGMHPFQVLFARQVLTMTCCVVYMWWTKTPDWPFGPKEVRWLLFLRGFSGFFGIYGMWYSMMYLPLAEATVITFLAPSVAGLACWLAFREPFTRVEQIGTLVAFAGVVLIAHPTALFSSGSPSATGPPEAPGMGGGEGGNGTSSGADPDSDSGGIPGMDHEATPTERLQAIIVGLIGVLGAAGAFTAIRWIGKRAHALISVNYFATWCTLVTTSVLTIAPLMDYNQPDLSFALPQGVKQWFLLIFLGIMGFIMQFLMTAGLGHDRSNRANAMVFTHMLFAAGFDRWVFGQSMGWMSLAGCGLIIGSALYMVLSKNADSGQPKREGDDVEAGLTRDREAVPMLMDMDNNNSNEDEELDTELEDRRTPLGG